MTTGRINQVAAFPVRRSAGAVPPPPRPADPAAEAARVESVCVASIRCASPLGRPPSAGRSVGSGPRAFPRCPTEASNPGLATARNAGRCGMPPGGPCGCRGPGARLRQLVVPVAKTVTLATGHAALPSPLARRGATAAGVPAGIWVSVTGLHTVYRYKLPAPRPRPKWPGLCAAPPAGGEASRR